MADRAIALDLGDESVAEPQRPRLGEMLVAAGACTPEAVQQALQNQRFWGGRLGTNLLRIRAVRETDLAEALQKLHGVPALSGEIHPDPTAIKMVGRRIIDRYDAIPYVMVGGDIGVLVSDPSDLRVLDDLRFATGKKIEPLIVPEARLWSLMWRLYGLERGTKADREDIDEQTDGDATTQVSRLIFDPFRYINIPMLGHTDAGPTASFAEAAPDCGASVVTFPFGGRTWEGPYAEPAQLPELPGVYGVWSWEGSQWAFLDVGHSEDVRHAVQEHERKMEWPQHGGAVHYGVTATPGLLPGGREQLVRWFRTAFSPAFDGCA